MKRRTILHIQLEIHREQKEIRYIAMNLTDISAHTPIISAYK